MKTKLLYLFTRTPMHIGAGTALGAVDQPLLRERHTLYPVVPGSTMKGGMAALWCDDAGQRSEEGRWLFGSATQGGVIRFSDARLLAFPMRSARAGFAWITCPFILRRLARDGGLPVSCLPNTTPRDDQALFAKNGPLSLGDRVVLEEYALSHAGEISGPGAASAAASGEPQRAGPLPGSSPGSVRTLGDQWRNLAGSDPVWSQLVARLVVVSDGMMSYFAQSACEIAQRASLDDARGAAPADGFFSQENIPAESLFCANLDFFEERLQQRPAGQGKSPAEAFQAGLKGRAVQLGADASVGLGLCSVVLADLAS